MEENFGVLVLGHGSKLTYNKNTVEAVANMLAENEQRNYKNRVS